MELGRNAVMVAKAKALAEKNGTTFEEEYSALLKAKDFVRLVVRARPSLSSSRTIQTSDLTQPTQPT